MDTNKLVEQLKTTRDKEFFEKFGCGSPILTNEKILAILRFFAQDSDVIEVPRSLIKEVIGFIEDSSFICQHTESANVNALGVEAARLNKILTGLGA